MVANFSFGYDGYEKSISALNIDPKYRNYVPLASVFSLLMKFGVRIILQSKKRP